MATLNVIDLINGAETQLLKIHPNTQTEKSALAVAHSNLEMAKKMLAPPPPVVTPPPVVEPPIVIPPVEPPVVTPPPSGGLVQPGSFTKLGTFRLPQTYLGSSWGFSNSAGGGGLGAYGITFNPANGSIFIGGHPYEQRIAEIKIPTSFTGNPIATALQNLIDPFEGKIGTINPTDTNQKVLGGALVDGGALYVAAYSYYDGAVTQKLSWFRRPLDLSLKGQVVGPVEVRNGSTAIYPGWLDRSAARVPTDFIAALGYPMLLGGGGGAINGVQSWGPAAVSADLAGMSNSEPGTLVLGYPMDHPLANTSVGNDFWSEADVVAGCCIVPGTRSLLFVGKHGMGKYCYGTGAECGDHDDSSKGTHAYPYRSQVWAYDLNDLAAVKAGTKKSYDVKPYAVWELDTHFKEIQGIAYDSVNKHLLVSQVAGDPVNSGQPLIHVYQVA